MIPAREDEPARAVHERIERAAGRVLDHLQIAGERVEAVGAGDGGLGFVFIELREPRLVVVGPVAHENYFPIRRVAGRDVVAVRRLAGNFHDDWRRVRVCDDEVEVGEFVKLPEKFRRIRRVCRRTDDHAEQNFFTEPVDVRVAHVNADAVLDAVRAVAGLAREVHEAGVGGHQPEVAAARRVRGVGELVAEERDDGKERV